MSVKSKMFSIKNEQEQVKKDMFSRTAITSNERRPLRLDPSCRRWLVLQYIDHPISEAESVEFFDRFYAWMATPEAAAEIRHFFMNVEIEVYNANLCIRTATLDEMIGQSASVLEAAIKDFVSDGHAFVDAQLYAHINGELPEMGKRDIADLIKKHLVNEGYQRTRREITGLTKREWVWSKSPPGKRGEALRPEDEASMVEYFGAQPF